LRLYIFWLDKKLKKYLHFFNLKKTHFNARPTTNSSSNQSPFAFQISTLFSSTIFIFIFTHFTSLRYYLSHPTLYSFSPIKSINLISPLNLVLIKLPISFYYSNHRGSIILGFRFLNYHDGCSTCKSSIRLRLPNQASPHRW